MGFHKRGFVAVITASTHLAASTALRESEEKYRLLFDSLDEGFCIIEVLFGEDGKANDYRFLEINASFERQTGLAGAVGKTIRQLAPEHEAHWFEIYGRIVGTGEPERFESRAEALGRWYDVYAFPIGRPEERRVAVLFRDVLERKRAEARQALLLKLSDALRAEDDDERGIGLTATRLLAEHLGADVSYIIRMWPDENRSVVGPEFVREAARSFEGEYVLSDFPEAISQMRSRSLWVDDVRTDPGLTDLDKASIVDGLGLRSILVAPLRRGDKLIWALAVAMNTPRRWTFEELRLVEEVAERTWQAIERARAEAALRESEEQLQVLVAELQHRTRNLIGIVKSVAAHTIDSSETFPQFRTAFEERLRALSRIQGLLSRAKQEPISIAKLVELELSAMGAQANGRITLGGPDIALPEDVVQTLSLALHELATNALKYGAFSNDRGFLSVTWREADDSDGRRLHLEWVEQGLALRPSGQERIGFGRQLIEHALPYSHNARTRFEIGPTGVRCTIDLPVERRDRK